MYGYLFLMRKLKNVPRRMDVCRIRIERLLFSSGCGLLIMGIYVSPCLYLWYINSLGQRLSVVKLFF